MDFKGLVTVFSFMLRKVDKVLNQWGQDTILNKKRNKRALMKN